MTDDTNQQQPLVERVVTPEEIAAAKALPFEFQVGLRFLTNEKGMQIEVEYPEGVTPDEKNITHVLAWYITNAVDQLLPVAVNSWHQQRLAMAAAQRVNDAAANDTAGAIQTAAPRLLGPDAKPLDPSGVTGD